MSFVKEQDIFTKRVILDEISADVGVISNINASHERIRAGAMFNLGFIYYFCFLKKKND